MNESMKDSDCLELCKRLTREKLSWAPVEEWRNYEFTELGDKIYDATSVQLSITTLKRIFGKIKYDNLPSSSTLNALAVFLGFQSWMDLKSKMDKKDPGVNKKDPEDHEMPVSKTVKSSKIKRYLVAASLLAVVLVIAFSFIVLSAKTSLEQPNVSKVVFKSRSLANGLPNTVVFNVDLAGFRSDDMVIQQSWDSTKTIRLQPGQKEATAIYYAPGYYKAKLIVNGKIIKEHDLFIPSGKWIATIDHEPIPTYLTSDQLILKNGMTVSQPVLDQLRLFEKPVTITYHMVKNIPGLHSDNFIFETRIRNDFHGGPAVCQTAKIFLLAENGAFIIPFTIPGCVSNINLELGEKFLPGKSNDLSSFSADLSQWINVKLEVKNRRVKIFLDDKLRYEAAYTKDAGNIVGLRFNFLGAGSVDHFSFSNESGVAYKEDFR
jgi:hypothetical protein